jgi:nucleoside phosphorylase
MPSVDFVIIAPLEEERKAILSHLNDVCKYEKLAPSTEDIRVYYSLEIPVTAIADRSAGKYRVIVTSPSKMGRKAATAVTGDVIRRWKPRFILLVGIAGGIAARGINLGDVLAPEQIADYELQKIQIDNLKIRYEGYPTNHQLLVAVQNFDDEWTKSIKAKRPGEGVPKLHYKGGVIASGDKVVDDPTVLAKYQEDWPQLFGVEMEAGGVAEAILESTEHPGFFMIRGVSDFADGKKDSEDVSRWRAYACDVAASYTISFLQSGPVPLQCNGLDLTKLTDMLQRSGRASNASQRALCLEIGIDPDQLAFLNATPHDFAVQLIDYLNKTENRSAMVQLCKAIKLLLGESFREEVCQIQFELEYKS